MNEVSNLENENLEKTELETVETQVEEDDDESLGIVGFIISLFGLIGGPILSILSIILCAVHLRKYPEDKKWPAIAGIIISSIWILFYVYIILYMEYIINLMLNLLRFLNF